MLQGAASEGTYCTQLVLQGCYVKGAAARCRVLLLEWRVRSGAGWWCRCGVLLQGAAVKVVCVRFGVGMLVPLQELQGAVVGFSSEAAGGV